MAGQTELLYMTSFAADMFKAGGTQLLDSYRAAGCQEPLLVYYESAGEPIPDFRGWGDVRVYPLHQDAFLRSWLAANADIIPQYLGGKAKPCSCPGWEKMHSKHKFRCHYQWMNRNASRWFRKVVSWRHAARARLASTVVWLDSDCLFVKRPPVLAINQLFGKASVFYCRGNRAAPETGIVGFRFDREAGAFIEDLAAYYETGGFRREERWDDGYVLGRVVVRGDYLCRDLVDCGQQSNNEAIPYTDLARYLEHRKGLFGRKLRVMR